MITTVRKSMKPKVMISYHCPKCGGEMMCGLLSISSKEFEEWVCKSCKRRFKLTFHEILIIE